MPNQGSSRRNDRLKALRLPELAGRSFLDVRCDEGFFCGYALFQKASEVYGIDADERSISVGRERFPDARFLNDNWDNLPSRQFDVILCTAALHYAENQTALIERLVSHLSDTGVLVLEIGIHPGQETAWVEAERGTDTHLFATRSQIEKVLEKYAWRHVGPSVERVGDPVSCHVFHVSRRMPVAYLMMSEPASGKSTVSRGLFTSSEVELIQGDRLIHHIATGRRDDAPTIANAISTGYSVYRIAQAIESIVCCGLLESYVDCVVASASGRDFAYDGFIPPLARDSFASSLRQHGYMVVNLNWEPIGTRPSSIESASELATAYVAHLGPAELRHDLGENEESFRMGVVDSIAVNREDITIDAWAISTAGKGYSRLVVEMGGRLRSFRQKMMVARPDVQKHFGLPGRSVGVRFVIQRNDDLTLDDLKALSVIALDYNDRKVGQLRLGRRAKASLTAG